MKKKLVLAICIFLTAISVAYAANMTIEAEHQSFKEQENKAKFDGNVKVTIDEVVIKGPKAEVNINPKTHKVTEAVFFDNPVAFKNDKNKRSEVRSQVMKLSLITKILTAEGDSVTTVTESKKPTTTITADKQEYNTQSRILKVSGNVVVLHDDIKATCDTGYAYLDEKNEVKKLELTGSAMITQGDNSVEGDKLSFDTRSEIAIATGNTYTNGVMEDGTVLKVWAGLQQYNKKTGIILASKNVNVQYDEYKAQGPKATVYPDEKTKKLNQVVFTGRSKISTENRSIEADKITMFLNPKNFFADGNVKTSIPNIGDVKMGDEK